MDEKTSDRLVQFAALADLEGYPCIAIPRGKDPIPVGKKAAERKVPIQVLSSRADRYRKQELPVLYSEDLKIFTLYAGEKSGTVFLSGPFAVRPMNENQLRRYYEKMQIQPDSNALPVIMPFSRLLSLAVLQASLLGISADEDAVMRTNHLPETLLQDESLRDKVLFEMSEEQEERAHHTYQEEQYLLSCVREGKTEEALQQNAAMDLVTGRMSRKETLQWRKIAVVAITLCTRAAIEGGVSPARAYAISDYYMQKTDGCQTPSDFNACRNQAVRDLTEAVRKGMSEKKASSYVERCRDYVRKNYRKKIYVSDIADAMGISENYLSRIFAKETGEKLQDYIVRVRVEKAENLLRYSDVSIAEIAAYVNFPSQSYFGRVFRKYTGDTPGNYRNKWKPTEFT